MPSNISVWLTGYRLAGVMLSASIAISMAYCKYVVEKLPLLVVNVEDKA